MSMVCVGGRVRVMCSLCTAAAVLLAAAAHLRVREHIRHVHLRLEVDVVAAERIGQRDGRLLEAEADEDDDEKARDRHHRLELDHRVRDEQEVEREHEGQRVVVREGDRLRHRVDDVRAVPAQGQRLLLEGVEVG